MIRVFLDASVLFAAAYSRTGSSRDLCREAIRGDVQIVISQPVLEEVEANLTKKAPQALAAFHDLLGLIAIEVSATPTLEELQRAAAYIHLKDAPIVAAAVKAKVDYLVTWDRKHFMDAPMVAKRSGLRIVTPDELVNLF
jgi:putative PIN family toxin of toxin-antitoxin system